MPPTFHGFGRYVALGDSITEGIGDPDPTRPNGVRGFADRLAEELGRQAAEQGRTFGYANLAIRGRKLRPILAEQLAPALALAPDLVTLHVGSNDVIRPRPDLDALARALDDAVRRLSDAGSHVVLFTLLDPVSSVIYGKLRGRIAIFNEHVREIADRHGATVVDQWRMREVDLVEWMDVDRIHPNPGGHQALAIAVLDALGLPHGLVAPTWPPRGSRTRPEEVLDNLRWTRDHAGPWLVRRATRRSSGNHVNAKHPALEPLARPGTMTG